MDHKSLNSTNKKLELSYITEDKDEMTISNMVKKSVYMQCDYSSNPSTKENTSMEQMEKRLL